MAETSTKTAPDPALESRFPFGANWTSYLETVGEERIEGARRSIEDLLSLRDLSGKRFLDVGSGSGLFSLAALRMGARVTSFDFDPASVQCTLELRRRFASAGSEWNVSQGSVLDAAFVGSLGQHDVVYAWGVLHHTGSLWVAIENVLTLVRPGGTLCLAIYNFQPHWTAFYTAVKRRYARSGPIGRALIFGAYAAYQAARGSAKDILTVTNPFARYRKRARGMSIVHDWKDWIGGYPFETATPEAVFDFVAQRGFALRKLRTVGGGLGCNEFVFERSGVAG